MKSAGGSLTIASKCDVVASYEKLNGYCRARRCLTATKIQLADGEQQSFGFLKEDRYGTQKTYGRPQGTSYQA